MFFGWIEKAKYFGFPPKSLTTITDIIVGFIIFFCKLWIFIHYNINKKIFMLIKKNKGILIVGKENKMKILLFIQCII